MCDNSSEDDDVDGLRRDPEEEAGYHHPNPTSTTSNNTTTTATTTTITKKRPRLENQPDVPLSDDGNDPSDHDNSSSSSSSTMLCTDIPDPTRHTCITVDATTIEPSQEKFQQQPTIRLGEQQSASSSSLLQDLFYPLDAQVFLQQCFAQCAVHVPGTAPARSTRFASLIADSLFDLDPLQLLRATASEAIFVWLSSLNSNNDRNHPSSSPPLIHSIEVPNPNDAFHLYQTGGHSTYCRAPPEVERALVEALLQDTGLTGSFTSFRDHQHPLARGEVELFISARPGSVTGWHYDFQHNFTLQLSGCKRWKLQSQSGRLTHPLSRGCTPHYASNDNTDNRVMESQLLAARIADPDFTLRGRVPPTPPETSTILHQQQHQQEIITMHPGDVLYFPAGMWHQVEVLEPGVSLNISLMATHTYASLTCQALQHYLVQQSPAWRRPIQNISLGERGSSSAVEQLQTLLQDLPDLVRALTQHHGGARAMLPPVLHCRRNAASGRAPINDEVEDAASDDDDDERPIRVADFVLPIHAPATNRIEVAAGRRYRLQRNPLARLLSESEFFSMRRYSSSDSKSNINANDDDVDTQNGKEEENGEETFVLNVSYAGNDALESLVRVRLVANSVAVQELEHVLAGKDDGDAAASTMLCANLYQQHPRLMDCLTFYGYIVWKEVT